MVDRPLRFCDVCGGLDDHPRHVLADVGNGSKPSEEFLAGLPDAPASAGALLLDPNTTIRHMDCCAAAGCQVCQATEEAHGGARGAELIASLESGVGRDLDVTDLTVGGTNG